MAYNSIQKHDLTYSHEQLVAWAKFTTKKKHITRLKIVICGNCQF